MPFAIAVPDAAGFERAHVFGYSMGGRACQWLAIPHAQLAIIDGARHGFIDECLDETCRLTGEFIAGHPVAAR